MSPSKTSTFEWEKFYNIIDGQQRGSDNIHHGVNPATGEELWDVPIGSEKDLNDAVAAARKAFPAWRDTPVEKRKEALIKFSEFFGQHMEDITTLLCKETGKPVRPYPVKNFFTSANSIAEAICRYGGRRYCRLYSIPL